MSIEYSCYSSFPVPLVSQIPTNWWELKEDKWQTATQVNDNTSSTCQGAVVLASTPSFHSWLCLTWWHMRDLGWKSQTNMRWWMTVIGIQQSLWLRFFWNPLKLSYHHHLNNNEWYNDCRTERNLRKGNSQWFSLCICHGPRLCK